MNTDKLINLLAQDAPVRTSLGRRLFIALSIGIAISIVMLISTIGVRPDILSALQTTRVLFKLGLTFMIAIAACNLVSLVGKPGVSFTWPFIALLGPLALLCAGVSTELSIVPENQWMPAMIGRHSDFCLFFVPLFSIAPFTALFIALKHGAPEDPGIAGAVVGLAAASIGATIYAWHCSDDSPLFLGCWYMLPIVAITLLGYLTGKRLLKW